MKIAVVGATGLVGRVMLEVLIERNFRFSELLLVASARSVGKYIDFDGRRYTIISMEEAVAAKPHIALFSAGGDTSLEWATRFAEVGCTVIDNSSAWRMKADKKLIVPEINAGLLTTEDKIIANPNCSTIQLVVALAGLHRLFGIQRLIVSTYQSVTGTGVKAVQQLQNERNGVEGPKAYPHTIDKNCLPHCDVFEDNGYTKEEMKLVNETRKIFDSPEIAVSATAVRVPVEGGHSESVNVQFAKPVDKHKLIAVLRQTEGVEVVDNPKAAEYPMPLMAKGKDNVFVGRIREDLSQKNSYNLWIVADNLRKGAATNAIQIAEYLISNNLVTNNA